MAEDLISSIIDNSAVEAEIKKVESRLDALATTIKTFPKAQVFYDSTGLKDLSAANKELSVVMKDLRVKNLELTNSIKEQQLAEKQLAAQRKQAIADAKDKANAEKEASRQAQIAGQEKLRQLAAEKKAQEDLASAESKRNEAEEKALSGTFTAGTSAPKKPTEQFIPTTASDSLALSLVQDQRQLAATKDAQKLLSAEFKAGNISQAEYDAQIVKSIQLQNDLKVSIANTTKELSLQAKSNASIPGTIEALQTRNAVLGQQRDQISVVNASPQDIANLKGINDEIDKNNELIRVNKDLLAQQKINIGNYPTALGQTFKTLNTELEQVQGKLVQGNFGGKEFDQLSAKQTVLQNALSLSGQTFKSTAAEASAYKEAAVQIGQVYGKDSSIFKQFAEGVKTGAANTKALANEVDGVAKKGKGFSSFLGTAYGGLRRLANVLPNFGISTAILLIGTAFANAVQAATRYFKTITDGKTAVQTLNDVNQKSIEIYSKQKSEVTALSEVVKDSSISLNDRKSALQKLIALNPDYLRGLTLENINTDEGRKILDKYNTALEHKAELEAAGVVNANANQAVANLKAERDALVELSKAGEVDFNDLSETQQKFLGNFNTFTANFKFTASLFNTAISKKDIKTILDGIDKEIKTEGSKVDASLKIYKKKFQENLTSEGDSVKGIIEELQEKIATLQKIQPTLLTPEAITKNVAEIKKYQDEIDKLLGKTTKDRLHRDTENIVDDFRKKTLKEQQEYLKALDEAELKQYKLMADDQNQSLTERLESERKYYEKSLQMAKQNTQDQADAVDLEASIAAKRAGKITDPKKRAETLIAIEDYRVLAIKRISEEGNAAILKINRDFYNENVTIADQAYEKIKKAAEESQKFIQEQQKIAFQNQKDQVDIDKDNQLLQLDKDFQNGKIKNLEEYNQRKQDIEDAADIKQKQLDLKRIQDAEKVFEALYPGFKNQNFIKEALDLEVQINEISDKKILDSKKARAEKEKELARDLADFLESALLSSNQKQLDQLDKESQNIDDKTQKEIDTINASTLAEEEKQKRITAAQKQAAFEQEQIKKRQDALERQRQMIQRLAQVAEVGAQIAQEVFAINAKAAEARSQAFFLLTSPFTAPFAPAAFAASAAIQGQVPFVLASGALALIKAAAFEKGTDNAPKGPAIVGEKGSELVVTKEGQMYVTPPRPTLIDLAGGEQIFRHDITEDFLKHHNLLSIIQKAQSSKQPSRVENNFNEKIYRELRSLNGKPPFIIQVQNGMETSDYYFRNIKR